VSSDIDPAMPQPGRPDDDADQPAPISANETTPWLRQADQAASPSGQLFMPPGPAAFPPPAPAHLDSEASMMALLREQANRI
jgi:hypothetical protein